MAKRKPNLTPAEQLLNVRWLIVKLAGRIRFADREDAIQDCCAFMLAVALPKYDSSRAALTTYVWTVAARFYFGWQRKDATTAKRKPDTLPVEVVDTGHNHCRQIESIARLVRRAPVRLLGKELGQEFRITQSEGKRPSPKLRRAIAELASEPLDVLPAPEN